MTLTSIPTFTVMPVGTRWPSGRYASLAVLALESAQVEEVVGCALNSGTEVGLGPWVGTGFALSSGQLVELVKYANAPGPQGFEVRVDANAICLKLLTEIRSIFNVEDENIIWVLPQLEA